MKGFVIGLWPIGSDEFMSLAETKNGAKSSVIIKKLKPPILRYSLIVKPKTAAREMPGPKLVQKRELTHRKSHRKGELTQDGCT